MLRLIRRFNRLQIPEDRTKSYWIYTITEFVFIILGILIALQINNWNENRKEKRLEEKILTELLINLEENVEGFEWTMNYIQSFMHSTQIVLDHLLEEKPFHDSLTYHFGHLYGTTVSSTNNAAYESLKSIGIDLIKDDNIRLRLADLFDNYYQYLAGIEESEHIFLQNHFYESITEELDMIVLYENAIPLNYPELHKNNKFIQDLRMSLNVKRYSLRANRRALNSTVELIADIKAYLK